MTIFIFNFPAGEICSEALNLSDTSKFPDINFKTSPSSNGHEARITSSGWCFGKDKAAYLQIDLTLDYVITQIATFGNKDRTKWMTSYSLKYSKDEKTINSDGEVKVYIYICILAQNIQDLNCTQIYTNIFFRITTGFHRLDINFLYCVCKYLDLGSEC